MYSKETLLEIKKNVIKELEKACVGQPSSFPFISHALSEKPLVKAGEKFQVLSIGGSYFRNSLLQTKDGKLQIIKNTTGALPQFANEDLFLQFILEQIDKTIEHVAVNFAYPLIPIMRHNILDGILQNGSKEHEFDGMIDKTIGRLIEEHIMHKWDKQIHAAVANDTMCLLLSGLMNHTWDTLAAGIVGTGLNFAIFTDKNIAVNLEAANFKKFPPTDEAIEIDKYSISPGSAMYEKEIAGAYLYRHFNIHIQKKEIDHPLLKSTDELDALSRSNIPQISALAKSILDHSAILVGTQIAGILEFCKRDLTFIMQGSMYWNANEYSKTVSETVQQLTSEYKASYIDIKDSDIFGAAELLLHD